MLLTSLSLSVATPVFDSVSAHVGAVLGMLLIMSGVTVCVLSSVSGTDGAGAHNTSDL